MVVSITKEGHLSVNFEHEHVEDAQNWIILQAMRKHRGSTQPYTQKEVIYKTENPKRKEEDVCR